MQRSFTNGKVVTRILVNFYYYLLVDTHDPHSHYFLVTDQVAELESIHPKIEEWLEEQSSEATTL
jgi:hypothetical protein